MRLYLGGDQSLREIASKNNVSTTSLHNWVQLYKIDEPGERYEDMKEKTPSKNIPTDSRDKEIQQLKEQLRKAELKALALDKMIDIAEKELKIDIRKKSGAKQ